MKLLLALALMVGFTSVAQGQANEPVDHVLQFANGTYLGQVTWVQGPRVRSESSFHMQWVSGTDGAPTEPPGDFKVVLWMPGMGHGSSPTHIQQSMDSSGQPLVGAYEVTSLNFIMGGKWDVNITLKFADGSEETQTIALKVP